MKVVMEFALGILFLLAPTHCRDMVGDQEVKVFLIPKTFAGAIGSCKENGMKLLLIRNFDEELEAVALARKYGINEFWLAATDIGHESWFTSTTGEPLAYANWHRGEPNNGGGFIWDREENCVNIWMPSDDSHGWNDHKCYTKLRYFCVK